MAFYRGATTGSGTFTNGDGTVTFGGTVNMLANARAGEEIRGPDGKNYEIYGITDAQEIEIKPDYEGATATSANWHVVPVQGYQRDLASAVAAAIAEMSSWSNLAVADGKVPQYRGTDWAMRTPAELLLDLLTGTAAVDSIPAAATVDLGASSSPIVEITGSGGPITSFGSEPFCIRVVRFADNPQLNNETTHMKLLTNANRAIASGSCGLYVSDALGDWTEYLFGAHA